MDYKILLTSAYTVRHIDGIKVAKESLESQVNQAISQGWTPLGGVSICGDTSEMTIAQAVVKS